MPDHNDCQGSFRMCCDEKQHASALLLVSSQADRHVCTVLRPSTGPAWGHHLQKQAAKQMRLVQAYFDRYEGSINNTEW